MNFESIFKTDQDKREFVEDGLSEKRRKDFEMSNKMRGQQTPMSLDGIQKIFPAPPVSRKKTPADFNKL